MAIPDGLFVLPEKPDYGEMADHQQTCQSRLHAAYHPAFKMQKTMVEDYTLLCSVLRGSTRFLAPEVDGWVVF
jgi:hypothetical protein